MLYYEQRIRIMPATLRVCQDQLVWYRNAAWMLKALRGAADGPRATRAFPIEPHLFHSALFGQLRQQMLEFFSGVFKPASDLSEGSLPEFVFYSFYATDYRIDLEGHPYLWLLYQMLTHFPMQPESVVQLGCQTHGLPKPKILPPGLVHSEYIQHRLQAARLASPEKSGVLALSDVFNLRYDNPFLCIYGATPTFTFHWGGRDFSIQRFDYLRRQYRAAKPVLDLCSRTIERFRYPENPAWPASVLATLWKSLLFPGPDPI